MNKIGIRFGGTCVISNHFNHLLYRQIVSLNKKNTPSCFLLFSIRGLESANEGLRRSEDIIKGQIS